MWYGEHGDPIDNELRPGLGAGVVVGVLMSGVAFCVVAGGGGGDGTAGRLALDVGDWWGPLSWVLLAPGVLVAELRSTVAGAALVTALAWPLLFFFGVLPQIGG